jgi:hypothetical protein
MFTVSETDTPPELHVTEKLTVKLEPSKAE